MCSLRTAASRILLGLLAGALPSLAQQPPRLAAADPAAPPQLRTASPGDSAAAVEAARDAQGRFERERVRLVGRDRWGFPGGCDERIGRMCMRLEGGSDWWWPDAEEPELAAARERLVEALDAAAARAPGDPWLLGQRVIYRGEAGRWDEAAALARACGLAEPWWCDALEGLALHVRGEYRGAETAFRRALSTMDPAEAEAWADAEILLDGAGADARKDALERGDPGAVDRFWRLSDPLFLVEGNDRWTEHLARRTWSRTREGARNPYAMSWGWDLDRLLVRYGWEVGWERSEPGPGQIGSGASAVGHQDPRGQSFVAPAAAWTGADSDPEDWNPGSRKRPRTGYVPAYAPVFLAMEVEPVAIPVGDSVRIVVRVPGIPDDTTHHAEHDHPPAPDPTSFRDRPPTRGLFLASLGGDGAVHGVTADGLEGPLDVTVPSGRYVVSVEVWDPAGGRAGRLRAGLDAVRVPRDVLALSDLLLARARGPLPGSVDEMLDDLLSEAVFAPGDTIRVAWVLHGLGWKEEALTYDVELREDAGGFFSRLGRAVGVVGERRGTGLDWVEAGPEVPAPVFRAVDLALPEELGDGTFDLRVTVETVGRNALVVHRRVHVRGDAPRR